MQRKRIALINSLRAYMKQEGYHFPEGFFQRWNYFERIKSLRVSDVQKGIFCSFIKSIEMLKSSEQEITDRMPSDPLYTVDKIDYLNFCY